jgi:serine/threonine protein kinase
MEPRKIGRYEIRSEVGRGGMADVYLAHDPFFERDVAIKVLPPEFLRDPMFRARFEREAKTIASLDHEAIVQVYDYGEEEGQPFLVMRYMSGGSLADRIEGGPLPLAEAIRILKHLAPALDEAHAKGVIHRDLKPSNILFDQRGNPTLSDFGIVKVIETTASLTGSGIIGTPAYMSPEQVIGKKELDGRSDIYALSVILFQMLTGKLPYEADTPIGLAFKHVNEPVPSIRNLNPDLPLNCETVVMRGMAKDPQERYSKADELVAALEAPIEEEKVLPEPTLKLDEFHAVGAGKPTEIEEGKVERMIISPPFEKPRRKVPIWVWIFGGLIPIVVVVGIVIGNARGRESPIEAVVSPATQTEETAKVVPLKTKLTPTHTLTIMPTKTLIPTPTSTLTKTPTSTPSKTPSSTHTPVPRYPFPNWKPHVIPGQIEAEDYDIGGEGVSYHDTSYANEGKWYRNDWVDISEDFLGGYKVGWISEGEWLEYTVEVTKTGLYDVEVNVASENHSALMHIEFDGIDVTGPIRKGSTGGWNTWKSVIVKGVPLTTGQYIMRLSMDTYGFNLNWIKFTIAEPTPEGAGS